MASCSIEHRSAVKYTVHNETNGMTQRPR